MANSKGNPKTLKVPSSVVARLNGSKGGKKKAENEKVRKTYKDLFLGLAETAITKKNDLSKGKLYEMITTMFPDLSPDEITQQVSHYASLHRIVLKGGKGAVAAFTAIRDTMGEKPVDEVHNTGQLVVVPTDAKKLKAMINKAKNA